MRPTRYSAVRLAVAILDYKVEIETILAAMHRRGRDAMGTSVVGYGSAGASPVVIWR
jgi:hypothetical protein